MYSVCSMHYMIVCDVKGLTMYVNGQQSTTMVATACMTQQHSKSVWQDMLNLELNRAR